MEKTAVFCVIFYAVMPIFAKAAGITNIFSKMQGCSPPKPSVQGGRNIRAEASFQSADREWSVMFQGAADNLPRYRRCRIRSLYGLPRQEPFRDPDVGKGFLPSDDFAPHE